MLARSPDKNRTIDYAMNVKNATYDLRNDNGNWGIDVSQHPLMTVKGNGFLCRTKHLAEMVVAQLECLTNIPSKELDLYLIHSTRIDGAEYYAAPSKGTIRDMLLADLVLQAGAGPEQVDQYRKWGGLFYYLDLAGLEYPHMLQGVEPKAQEDWIRSNGPIFERRVNDLVDFVFSDYQALSMEQRVAAIYAQHMHGSITYGVLLANGRVGPLEYTGALMAANCTLPMVFADVTRTAYKRSYRACLEEATLLYGYVEASAYTTESVKRTISKYLPGFTFLPKSARIAVSMGLELVENPASIDHSPAVVLFGKALEVSMKELIFDGYRDTRGPRFMEQQTTEVFLQTNKDVATLAKYIAKPPHHIELGGMITILQMHGGRTAKKNPVLEELFAHVDNIGKSTALSTEFLESADKLRVLRNDAAHSKVFDHASALDAQRLMIECLSTF